MRLLLSVDMLFYNAKVQLSSMQIPKRIKVFSIICASVSKTACYCQRNGVSLPVKRRVALIIQPQRVLPQVTGPL